MKERNYSNNLEEKEEVHSMLEDEKDIENDDNSLLLIEKDEKQEISLIYKFLHSEALLLILQCLLVSCTPIMLQLALWDPVLKKKKNVLFPETPFVLEFFTSVCIANIYSLVFNGKTEWKKCWSCIDIINLSLPSLLHSISVILQLISMVYLDGTSRSILNQLKLPFIAIFSAVFFKRFYPLARYFILVVVLLASTAFVSYTRNFVITEASLTSEYIFKGVPLGVITAFLSALAALVLDVQTKDKTETSYIIQLAQLRISSLFFVTICSLFHAMITHGVSSLFKKWSFRVVLLVLWLVMKDYSTVLLLKRLTAMHNALCISVALCLTFFLDTIIFDKKSPDSPIIFNTLIICFSIASFGSIKNDK
ncbi:uncharacterized protein LOC128884083 [Hylaeus volcanicus]|uniref:uncharacterized protein LOC128884083 n=1 Tax=Hylaeus volcanicus TaxID=313075 RepID=UPI0023B7B0BB|nr:uncharacterized protein LOC128884083 [Hylaeus volcanicus]